MECLNHRPRNQKKGKVRMPKLGIVHSLAWKHTDICDAAAVRSLKRLEKGLCVRSSCAPFDKTLACIYRKSEEFCDNLEKFSPPLPRKNLLSLLWNNIKVILGQLFRITFLSWCLLSPKVRVQTIFRVFCSMTFFMVWWLGRPRSELFPE